MAASAGGPPVEPEPAPMIDDELLVSGAGNLGLTLPPDTLEAMRRYATELVSWNARVNLTRLTEPDEIAVQHLLDSLVCLLALPARWVEARPVLSCVDIGSGAGLPGIALKLARPEWRLTLIESTLRKAAFLDHVVGALSLTDVRVEPRRAEACGRDPELRGAHHLAVARAVADLSVLVEYALPLLRPGGLLLALKGADAMAEVDGAERALAAVGGSVLDVRPYHLPGVDRVRHVIVVRKVGPTPDVYPRREGMPTRRPL